MKAMILAAGLGTRLKPWTLSHPKALVPVGGVPMLQRVISNLRNRGFDDITVNVHHFADQIVDFLNNNDFGIPIKISDESDILLDTGGAIRHASSLLTKVSAGPVLIHNVDILSSAPLEELMARHNASGSDITLMVSHRESTRGFFFDSDMRLRGWGKADAANPETLLQTRPEGMIPQANWQRLAFSGIYVVSPSALEAMHRLYRDNEPFSIVDFLLRTDTKLNIRGILIETPDLIDIGKPDSLRKANLAGV